MASLYLFTTFKKGNKEKSDSVLSKKPLYHQKMKVKTQHNDTTENVDYTTIVDGLITAFQLMLLNLFMESNWIYKIIPIWILQCTYTCLFVKKQCLILYHLSRQDKS